MASLVLSPQLINEALRFVDGYISGQFPFQKQTIRGMVNLLFQASQQQQYSTVSLDIQLHKLCDYCLAHSLDLFEVTVIQTYLYTFKRDQPYSALQSLYQASTQPIPRIGTAYVYIELYITLFNHLFSHYQYEMLKMQYPVLTLIYDDPTDKAQGESFQFDLVRFRSSPYTLPLDQDVYSNLLLYSRYQQQKLSQSTTSTSFSLESPTYLSANGSSSGQLSSVSSSTTTTSHLKTPSSATLNFSKQSSVQATPSIRNNPSGNPHISTPQGKRTGSNMNASRLYDSQDSAASRSATKTPSGAKDSNGLPTHFEDHGIMDEFNLNTFDDDDEEEFYNQHDHSFSQPPSQSRSLFQQSQKHNQLPTSSSSSSSSSSSLSSSSPVDTDNTQIFKTDEQLAQEKAQLLVQLDYAQSLRDSFMLKFLIGMGAFSLSTLFVLQRDFKQYLYQNHVSLEPEYEIQITPDGRRRRRKIRGRQSVHDLQQQIEETQ